MIRPFRRALPIPYEDIDVEVRRLVQLINQIPGIKTVESCAGHEPHNQAVIGFAASNQAALCRLLDAMPFLGVESSIWGEVPILRSICLTVEKARNKCLHHKLRITGFPIFAQRQLVMEIERHVTGWLASPRRHLSCSKCGSKGSADKCGKEPG